MRLWDFMHYIIWDGWDRFISMDKKVVQRNEAGIFYCKDAASLIASEFKGFSVKPISIVVHDEVSPDIRLQTDSILEFNNHYRSVYDEIESSGHSDKGKTIDFCINGDMDLDVHLQGITANQYSCGCFMGLTVHLETKNKGL